MTEVNRKIRVGLLLNSFDVPAWAFRMIELIQESNHSKVVVLIKNETSSGANSKKIRSNSDKIAYRIYRKLDRKIFKVSPDAFKRKNINDLLSEIPVIKTTPRQTKYSDYIPEEDLVRIQDQDIDVFIRLGFRILRGDILKASKYGIWSYHHGDNKVNRGGPPGFWEVMNNEDETGVVLQILTENLDSGLNLFKSFSLTDNISVNRNANNYYWKALSFLPDKLKELSEFGEKEFFRRIKEENRELQFYDRPLYKDPGNLKMLQLLFKKGVREIKKRFNDLFFYDQWILLFRLSKRPVISKAFYQFKEILPPKDRIWADPFVVFRNNRYYIFIEELFYSTNKGHISVIIMDMNGNFEEPVPVLKKDYHLSYPNVFEQDGEMFMIPETKENRSIELYRCVEFPHKWKFEYNLMEKIYAVDTTIHFENGLYWMFTNIRRNKGASSHDELFLYYSKDLKANNWQYHPKNPIVSDVKSARPAGKIFKYNGDLYRPSQDCSKHYGYGLNLNKIEILNVDDYKESLIDKVLPEWDDRLKGVHTFNFDVNLTLSDAIYRRPKYW